MALGKAFLHDLLLAFHDAQNSLGGLGALEAALDHRNILVVARLSYKVVVVHGGNLGSLGAEDPCLDVNSVSEVPLACCYQFPTFPSD